VESVGSATSLGVAREHVLPESTIYSDEHRGYDGIKGLRRKDDTRVNAGYKHRRVHYSSRVYVMGDTHTNSVEGFWRIGAQGLMMLLGRDILKDCTLHYDGKSGIDTLSV